MSSSPTGALLHLGHNIVLMGICYDLTSKTELAKILVSESGLVTAAVYAVFAIWYWRISANRSGPDES